MTLKNQRRFYLVRNLPLASAGMLTVTVLLPALCWAQSAHEPTIPLGANAKASVQTAQSENMLYVQSSVGGVTARIGLNTAWGGSIVEASVNGVNYVNHHDSGREVQLALYDGSQRYDSCAGCTGDWGWNPVQAGDRYSHGSPVLAKAVTADSIYVKTRPLEWYPDNKGGGPTTPVLTDTYFEQTITTVPGYPLAFRAHYRLTYFGTDTHAATRPEIPAIYVNAGYSTFVYYGGINPWTNDAITKSALVLPPAGPFVCAPEYWGALVDSDDMGLTVFVPAAYPRWAIPVAYQVSDSGDEAGESTNYFRPLVATSAITAGSVIEGDIYLMPGDYKSARQTIYALHQELTLPDTMAPVGSLDTPGQNAHLSNSVHVSGWTFDNVAVSKVEISVDSVIVGQAMYGLARPDVVAVYPGVPNPGYDFSLDTTNLIDGPHKIAVSVTDTSNNVTMFGPVPVIVDNSSMQSLTISAGHTLPMEETAVRRTF